MLATNLLLKSPIKIFLVLIYPAKIFIVEGEIVSYDKPAYHHDEFRLHKYGEGEQKGLDQWLSLHSDPTKVEHPRFNIDLSKGKDQQNKNVFPVGFYYPVADYMELISSIDIKIFFSKERWFYHRFKPLFCWLCIPLFFGSISRTGLVNQFMTWLHWKHEFT